VVSLAKCSTVQCRQLAAAWLSAQPSLVLTCTPLSSRNLLIHSCCIVQGVRGKHFEAAVREARGPAADGSGPPPARPADTHRQAAEAATGSHMHDV